MRNVISITLPRNRLISCVIAYDQFMVEQAMLNHLIPNRYGKTQQRHKVGLSMMITNGNSLNNFGHRSYHHHSLRNISVPWQTLNPALACMPQLRTGK